MEVTATFTGSEGTALAAADLYNRIRICFFYTPVPSADNPAIPLYDVTGFCNITDVKTIYFDKVFSLPSQAFNSADYNAPGMQSLKKTIVVNRNLEWNNYTSSPEVNYWYTRAGNLYVAYVSDSSATPHPSLEMRTRLYYIHI